MEVNQEKAEAAKACFDYNKNLFTVNVTSDMNCFGKRGDAINHARTLEDKSIDVFERDAEEDVVLDEAKTDSANEEVTDIPDLKLAVVKANGGAKNKKFDKAPLKPVADEPAITPLDEAGYTAAKSTFSDLYKQWNAMPDTEQTSDAGKALSAKLTDLNEAIKAYEAANPAAGDTTDAPAADETADAPAADETADAPAADETADAPAADETADTPAADETADTPPADENITEKLTDLVDEIESLLHLKGKTE